MAIRFSKKFLVIAGILVMVILGALGSYIAWRLSQPEEVTPEESMACDVIWCCHCAPDEDCACCNGCPHRNAEGCYKCRGEDDNDDDDLGDMDCNRTMCTSDAWCDSCAGGTKSNAHWVCQSHSASRDDGCEQHCNIGFEWDDNWNCVSTAVDDDDKACSCDDWNYNGCGRGCTFPGGINCGGTAESNPGHVVIQWCTSTNNATCRVDPPAGCECVVGNNPGMNEGTCGVCGNAAWRWNPPDEPPEEPPDEPPDEPSNVCDTGSLDNPTSGSTFTVGSNVRIAGWAADSDGIDTSRIQVSIDGAFVGNATAVNACPDVRPDVCSAVGAGMNPVSWTYDWIATEGSHTISVVWYDLPGVTGTNCAGTTNILVSTVPKYLNLDGGVFCQDDNGPRLPVVGANVSFYQDGSLVETLTTNSSGVFSTSSIQSGATSYTLQLSRALPERTLSTGVSYSDMVGPELYSTSVCNSYACTCSAANYDDCTSLTSEGTNSGFRWLYTNCDLVPPDNPDWEMDKNGSPVCYEEGTANVYAEVNYTINIDPVTTGSGYIEYVEDTFDSRIDSNWIISTIPEATTITSDKITWTLGEGHQDFTGSYVVRIPSELFGVELHNEAIGYLSTDDDIYAYEDVFVTCAGPGAVPQQQPGNLPGTGIFDNVGMRLTLGAILVVLAYGYYKVGAFDEAFVWLADQTNSVYGTVRFRYSSEGRRKDWERKVVKSIDRKRSH